MNKNIILILLFLFCCRSSPEKSFINLSDAFINWYFRYNPIESTRYNIYNYNNNLKSFEESSLEEYHADVSRFLIELSQIDKTKLGYNERIDYNILYSVLDRMKYSIENHKEWNWNPLLFIDEIFNGIFLIIESSQFKMEQKVEFVLSRLKIIPDILKQSKKHISFFSFTHVEYSKKHLSSLIELLIKLPLKLNSDNLTLDKIDNELEKSIFAINEYISWLDNDVTEFDPFDFPKSLNLMGNGFKYYLNNKYDIQGVYSLAYNKLITIQNRMFNLCLPIYLKNNDEPIWLDRSDTLEIIDWTVNSILNTSDNFIDPSQVLSSYYKSITDIEDFINKKQLFSLDRKKSLQLRYVHEYKKEINQQYLFDHLLINTTTNPKYYVMYSPRLKYSKIKIDLNSAKYIVPGNKIFIDKAKMHPSLIRFIFLDKIMELGWQHYALKMIFDEGYKDWEDIYHIFKLQDELSIVAHAIVESKYYSGEINRIGSFKFLKEMAFMDTFSIEAALTNSDIEYFSGTQSFVGLLELISLKAKFQLSMPENFKLISFHDFIFKDGIIPINELKKQIK